MSVPPGTGAGWGWGKDNWGNLPRGLEDKGSSLGVTGCCCGVWAVWGVPQGLWFLPLPLI